MPLSVYELQTVGLLLKYCMPLGVLAALLRGTAPRHVEMRALVLWRPWLAWWALLAHRSQMVW